jgi:N-acetylglucosaminyldiphosphoundecaprenol N-acetyl-beta-D-mannosaminyltransferase
VVKTFQYFGVRIGDVDIHEVINQLVQYDFSKPGYICFPDNYVISRSLNDDFLRTILNSSLLSLPDGKPTAMMGRRLGLKSIAPVSGYWLCRELLKTELTHFFLGSNKDRLEKMIFNLRREIPNARIMGYSSPDFYAEMEVREALVFQDEFDHINSIKPDIIWIGISSPKQDFMMYNHQHLLQHGVMLGVGGVFDYLSGEVSKSPEWIKKIGMRWAWRLAKEPGRMWGKYFYVFRTMGLKYVKQYLSG